TFVKSNVDKLLDTSFQLGPKLAPAGGSSVGGTTLREVGQNVKKGWDNMIQAFAKNGDEGNKAYKNSRPKYAKGQVDEVFENAQKSNNGKVIDPSGKEITWDKSKIRNGQWDMGHIPGEKYSDMHKNIWMVTLARRNS
ncbi:GH-E family nuclease, partial [Streptococcus ruminantium]|nr:GH-E family nuclease [Streptococcus ruminantium]